MTTLGLRLTIFGWIAVASPAWPLFSRQTTPVSALISCFEAEHTARSESEACQHRATVEGVLLRPSSFDSATVADVADGLIRLALSSPDRAIRVAAATWLGEVC